MGILDGLKSFSTKFNTATPGKLSWADKLDQFGDTVMDFEDNGGRVEAGRKRRLDEAERRQAAEQRQQIAALADSLGLSPKEKLLYMANPKAFGELLKEQQSPYTLSEGSQRFGPNGESIAAAPKTMAFGDQILQAGPQGVNPLYTRNKTYAEQLAEQLGKGDLEVKRGQLGVAQGNLGVSRGRLGLSQKEYEARLKGVGGFGTPGAGTAILGPTLPPSWEEEK